MNYITIGNPELTVAQMFASPPEGLGPREWFVNLNELSHQIGATVNGEVTQVEINGTPKLVLLDDGAGMPAHHPTEFDLQTFVSTIAASGEGKNVSVEGNQGRGFRFAWSTYNPMGIIVLSKVAGGDTYRARWWLDQKTERWAYEGPVKDNNPLVDLGDHGTAFVMLGDHPRHNTAQNPFDGANEMRKGGTLFAALLTRRMHNPEANVRVTAPDMLVGGPGGVNNASKKVNFFGRDTSTTMTSSKVDLQNSGITLEWIEHTGPRWEERGQVTFGGTDLQSFATIVFDGEQFDWTEGKHWTYLSDKLGDLSYITDMVSVRIHLDETWRPYIKQSFDRTKLEWKTGMRDVTKRKASTLKGHGKNVVAVRNFEPELTTVPLYPQWMKDAIVKRKRERDLSVEDKQRARWEALVEKYKLMLGGSTPKDGDPFVVPMVGIKESGGSSTNNFFKKGAMLKVEIKPMSGEHEKAFPVVHRLDPVTGEWSMALSRNSTYVTEALNVAAAAFTKGAIKEFSALEPEHWSPVQTSVENAAQLTLGMHFLFVQVHKSKGLYSEEDLEMVLTEQPASTLALQHHFEWLRTIPAVIKADYQSTDKVVSIR